MEEPVKNSPAIISQFNDFEDRFHVEVCKHNPSKYVVEVSYELDDYYKAVEYFGGLVRDFTCAKCHDGYNE